MKKWVYCTVILVIFSMAVSAEGDQVSPTADEIIDYCVKTTQHLSLTDRKRTCECMAETLSPDDAGDYIKIEVWDNEATPSMIAAAKVCAPELFEN